MENNSIYDYQPLSLVRYYIQEFFEEETVKESKLAFLAQVVLPLIGNRHQNVYRYTISHKDSKVSNGSKFIPVPCNLDAIEAVLDGNIDEYTYFNNTYTNNRNGSHLYHTFPTYAQNYGFHSIDCFVYKESREYHAPGNLVNYKFNGDEISISGNNTSDITVIYRGSIVDKDGLPLVTNREAIALAFYWNYNREFRRAVTRKAGDGNVLGLAEQLKTRWIMRARVPEHLSQNDLNNIKDSLKSAGFATYGKPMKFGR